MISPTTFDVNTAVLEAEKRIRPYIRETALDYSPSLSKQTGVDVFLKQEHQQLTGSFKVRGAMNQVLALNENQKRNGVICASTGNHGLGVAYAAKQADVDATVYLPKSTSSMKVDAIKDLGTKIVSVDGDCLEAETLARKASEKSGQVFISPYNNPFVLAGQGTIGVELARQQPDLDAVFISVGGGGLISGVAGYLKKVMPNVKIIGCWPENARAMYESIKAGKIIDVPELPTISESTAGGVEEDSITFPLCQTLIDDHVLVSEAEIKQAMTQIAKHERWIVEGSAGVAMAALNKVAKQYQGKKVAVILCGRNIPLEKFNQSIKA